MMECPSTMTSINTIKVIAFPTLFFRVRHHGISNIVKRPISAHKLQQRERFSGAIRQTTLICIYIVKNRYKKCYSIWMRRTSWRSKTITYVNAMHSFCCYALYDKKWCVTSTRRRSKISYISHCLVFGWYVFFSFYSWFRNNS